MEKGDRAWAVLVVDDSEDFLKAACIWLETLPEVLVAGTARDGRGALEQAARLSPDLIVMDAVMPVMDGFEATRRIKEREGAPKVVIVSLHDSKVARDEAWVSGADGFVAKADLTTEFAAMIRALRSGAGGPPQDRPRAAVESAEESRLRSERPVRPAPPTGDVSERKSEGPGSLAALLWGWLLPAFSSLRTQDGPLSLRLREAHARNGGPQRL